VTRTDPTLRLLLRAVLADPADDTARLAMSDALEEAGDGERASHVRWMVAHPDAGQSFVGGHDSLGWFPATHAMGDKAVFTIRRGFVAEVRCTLADYEAHAAALFAAQPIERVTLTDREPRAIVTEERYGWYGPGFFPPGQPDDLPLPIMDIMAGRGVRYRFLRTRDDALDALSAALCLWGRRLARIDVPCDCEGGKLFNLPNYWTPCQRCQGTGWVLNTDG
jgi:uncharacterized protein (TIGR02996 family)